MLYKKNNSAAWHSQCFYNTVFVHIASLIYNGPNVLVKYIYENGKKIKLHTATREKWKLAQAY